MGITELKRITALEWNTQECGALIARKTMLEWAVGYCYRIAGTAMHMVNFKPEERDNLVLGPSDSGGAPLSSTTNDFKMLLAKALGNHFGMEDQETVEWRAYFLATDIGYAYGQTPHVDHEFAGPTRRLKKPLWAMDMPLTEGGLFLKVWPGANEKNPVVGQKLFLTRGEICLRRSTLIHAGGLNGQDGGFALRMHASLGTEGDHETQLNMPRGGTYGTDPRSKNRVSFKTFCL